MVQQLNEGKLMRQVLEAILEMSLKITERLSKVGEQRSVALTDRHEPSRGDESTVCSTR
jgi:hypothetical protein